MLLDGSIKIAPSKRHGVGVFSNTFLKKGHVIFNFHWNNYKNLRNIEHLPDNQKSYLRNIFGSYNIIYSDSFHPVNFLNHGYKSNVHYDKKTGNYVLTKNVKPNTELVINYKGYHDSMLDGIKKEKKTRRNRTRRNRTRKLSKSV